jgi:hypothetical protein
VNISSETVLGALMELKVSVPALVFPSICTPEALYVAREKLELTGTVEGFLAVTHTDICPPAKVVKEPKVTMLPARVQETVPDRPFFTPQPVHPLNSVGNVTTIVPPACTAFIVVNVSVYITSTL